MAITTTTETTVVVAPAAVLITDEPVHHNGDAVGAGVCLDSRITSTSMSRASQMKSKKSSSVLLLFLASTSTLMRPRKKTRQKLRASLRPEAKTIRLTKANSQRKPP